MRTFLLPLKMKARHFDTLAILVNNYCVRDLYLDQVRTLNTVRWYVLYILLKITLISSFSSKLSRCLLHYCSIKNIIGGSNWESWGRSLILVQILSFSCSFPQNILPNNRFFSKNAVLDASRMGNPVSKDWVEAEAKANDYIGSPRKLREWQWFWVIIDKKITGILCKQRSSIRAEPKFWKIK